MVTVEWALVRGTGMLLCVNHRRSVGFALAVFAGPLVAGASEFAPFRAPNLSPPVAIVGLPLWAEVPDATTFGFTTEIANHYRLSARAGDTIILDGETVRLRGHVERPFGNGWSVSIDLPIFSQSGGVLDDIVDGWHSAFGLPDGGRNFRPEGQLEFDLADSSGQFFRLDDPGSDFGDLQLGIARRVGAKRNLIVRGTVKLPTGSEALMAGSGETDFSVSVMTLQSGMVRGHEAAWFVGGALLDFGQPDNVRFPVEDGAMGAVLGGALSLKPRFGVKGQLDIYSALYETQLEELGQSAVQATLGGWLQFGDRGLFEFAISEDLHVSTTPDVVFFFNLSWRRP
jgi:hypothetical protein